MEIPNAEGESGRRDKECTYKAGLALRKNVQKGAPTWPLETTKKELQPITFFAVY